MLSFKKEDLENILPKNGPPIEEVYKYIEKYKNDLIVIKYGGNVFIDRNIFNNFIVDISILNKLGLSIVVVHGGGPRIKRELEKSNIQSKFIRGLRVTNEQIINIVEKSESIVIDKMIKGGQDNEEGKNKVIKIITELVEKNPEKAVEILEKNRKTKDLAKNIKTKIENKEAINADDFEKVFRNNVSPN